MMNCSFPGCRARLEPNQAKVPAVATIRSMIGKPVTVAELANHALCGRHARMAREEKVPVFSYAGTVTLLERRQAERVTAQAHFLQLRAKTQMGKAIAKAFAEEANAGQSQSS